MRKMFRKGGTIACLAVSLMAVLAGCEDECSVGKSECKRGNVLRTCVATDDGNQWVYNQCGSNEACVDAEDFAADGGDGVADGGGVALTLAALTADESANVTAACIGTCSAGQTECLGATTSRYCAGNGVWQIIPCSFGQECIAADGVCKASTGPNVATLCNPNAKACASTKVEKVCNPDGTAWTETPCAMNETCTDDECVPDEKSSCDDMNMCIDSTTAARCQAGGQGFVLVECPDGTWCEGGNCQGNACVLGKTCNGPNQVRECKDGSEFIDTQCGANEVCQQLKDDAKCVPQACALGTTQCGDPRDSKVDPATQFTTCAVDPAGSALNRWVVGTCEGTTTCNNDPDNNPATPTPTTPCTQTCTPGAERCAPFNATGVSQGKQVCNKDGEWDAVENCNEGTDIQLSCVVPAPKPGELPKALCAEPVCAYALANPASAKGFCEDGKLVECLDDGTLADEATDCDPGICNNDPGFGVFPGLDGRIAGICNTMTVCTDGEKQCLGGSTYQECVNGLWSTKLETCDNDKVCRNILDGDNLRDIFCGGECTPGSRSCDFSTAASSKKIFTCSKDGKLDDGVKCDLGYCAAAGNDANCIVDCIPGSFLCSGSNIIAPDGFHTGTNMEQKCGADGTWGTATACSATTACRTSSIGTDLGCIECIGPDVAGGNAEGRADSRCAPNDPTEKLQDCTPANEWDTARSCGGNTVCAGPKGPTCGDCYSGGGAYLTTCSEAAVNDTQICGGCAVNMGGATATPCTPANINALTGMALGCAGADVDQGTASLWDGVQCCSGAQSGITTSCASEFLGTPTAVGGTADCCSGAIETSSGVSFAACYEP